jgi:uroporphyrin-III C-methyltransferase
VPMAERRPLLLRALNDLYEEGSTRAAAPGQSADALAGQYASGESAAPPILQTAAALQTAADELPIGDDSDGGDETGISTPRSAKVQHAAEGRATRTAAQGTGSVSLVGAGPGDPGLLTRRAAARLRAADLVLYDALIDRRILALARHAQRFFVGKRAGRRAMSQQTINALMIRAARRGKRVVRLKGGDPFVFGRGGEEMLALRAAGIRAEIVPGVTSAVAAPALAGIPVTHRQVSSAFLVVGGHDQQAFASAIETVVRQGATLVVLMGLGRRALLAQTLLAKGWRPDTPAAIVMDASRAHQTVWRGTLEGLAAEGAELETDGPGTIVVGDVVAVADGAAQAIGPASHVVSSTARGRIGRRLVTRPVHDRRHVD